MRILHVIRDLAIETGGPVTALRGMAEAQAALGHEVTILATNFGDGPRAEVRNTRVSVVPAFGGSWGWSPFLSSRLARMVTIADIVHLHMVWDYPVWAAARVAARHSKPFILRPCGQLDPWSLSQKRLKKAIYRWLFSTPLRKAAAIHFTTDAEHLGTLPIIGATRSFVIPIGVPEATYQDLPAKTAFGERFPELAGKRIVLFLGRLHPKKQPELLIEAFAQVAFVADDLRLVLAGPADSAYLAHLKAQAEAFGVSQRTAFTGPLTGRSITEAYRAADVFVLPSLQENFGIAVVEAMAAGCPVLISDRLDLARQIDIAKAGLVRQVSAQEFSTALRALIDDGPMREQMGVNGRRLVMERYSWEPIARSLVEAYDAVLSGAG